MSSQFCFGVAGIGEYAVARTAQVNDSLQRHIQIFEIDGDTQLGLETGDRDAPVQGFHRLAVAVDFLRGIRGIGLSRISRRRRVVANLSEDGFEHEAGQLFGVGKKSIPVPYADLGAKTLDLGATVTLTVKRSLNPSSQGASGSS